MLMKKIEMTPLDELRREKEVLKAECSEREERLGEYWAYINDNAGSLIIDGVISAVKSKLGLTSSKKSSQKQQDESFPAKFQEHDGTGFMNTIKTGLQMTYPLIWEIAQPMLWEFAIKKVKSIFTRKKKKKKKKDDCDED